MTGERDDGKGFPLMDALSAVMDSVGGTKAAGLDAEAQEKAAKERERLDRRATRERVRRASQLADEARLARLFASGRAVRPLLGASRFMSRRGLKVLRDLATKGNVTALRLLCDMSRTLALLEYSAREHAKGQPGGEPQKERRIVATWPDESVKS